jgi:hypothetical protein
MTKQQLKNIINEVLAEMPKSVKPSPSAKAIRPTSDKEKADAISSLKSIFANSSESTVGVFIQIDVGGDSPVGDFAPTLSKAVDIINTIQPSHRLVCIHAVGDLVWGIDPVMYRRMKNK